MMERALYGDERDLLNHLRWIEGHVRGLQQLVNGCALVVAPSSRQVQGFAGAWGQVNRFVESCHGAEALVADALTGALAERLGLGGPGEIGVGRALFGVLLFCTGTRFSACTYDRRIRTLSPPHSEMG